jgi:hypothetical protein
MQWQRLVAHVAHCLKALGKMTSRMNNYKFITHCHPMHGEEDVRN